MRKSLPAILLSSMFLINQTFAESLEFIKSTVDSYQPGSAPTSAMMTMNDGKTHETIVQLQKDVPLKDLMNGNLIFIPEHNEVFQVTNVNFDADGNKIVEIKSTNLFVGLPKLHGTVSLPDQNPPQTMPAGNNQPPNY